MDEGTVGDRLKRIRKEVGYSQQAFSKELKITQQSYSLLERDKRAPNIRVLGVLWEKFNVNLNWLVMGHGKMFREFSENVDLYRDKADALMKMLKQIEGLFKDLNWG